MVSKVGFVVVFAMVLWEVSCQETRLNVIFPQLEKIGTAPEGKDTQSSAALLPAPGDKEALRLQQLQSEISRLKGLVKTLVSDDVSGKNERLEVTSSRPAVTVPPAILSTQKPKDVVSGGGISNFFANLGSETSANANDFNINSLHSEIEALQKQLSGRDDNNSRNSFINQPIKESPTTFHFHSDKNPPHQSYFDHSAQGDQNSYFYHGRQKLRSVEPAVSDTEYHYVVEPLPSPIVGNHIRPTPKSGVKNVKASKTTDESESEPLILRHQHNPAYNDRRNGYGENYAPHPHHRPTYYENEYGEDNNQFPYHNPAYYENEKYAHEGHYKPHPHPQHRPYDAPTHGYGEDYSPRPPEHHNYETRPEYGPPKYEETKDYNQPQTYESGVAYGHNTNKQPTHRLTGLLNSVTGGGNSVQNVILQFVLEVVRMIAGGNGAGVVSMIARLPGVLLRSFLQTTTNALAKDGLRGIIAKGIIPFIVLIVANILIIFLTWFMWEDTSRSCQENYMSTHNSKY